MKKYFNYLGIIAAAAMTLVSCAKEADNFTAEEPIKDGGEFTIVANPATKTTIDGYQTKWAAGDAINLFHAVAGSTTTVSDDDFTISSEDLASGTFKGTVSETLTAAAYDWYAIYPYNSYLESVKNDNANPARTYIGRRSDQAQEQEGNNSTAHLSGTNFPLFGKATSVAKDDTPAITLSSIASFVEVKVTNKNDDPLTVTSVSFTAPDGSEIVGQYNIDFSAEPFTFTKYKTYVSDVANLTVNNGTPIAKGETASFYIGIKPFTAAAGSEFKVSVNGYEKTIHTTKANTFQSGKIKTVNFDYDYVGPKSFTWDLSKNQTVTATVNELGWAYRGVTMVVNKDNASTSANNYYGGDVNNRTSTRFYAKSILTITPYTTAEIAKVEFSATTTDYASALANSTWSNATVKVDGKTVTVTPTDGEAAFSATIGATCGFDQVTVHYIGKLADAVLYDVVVVDAPNGTITASEDSAEPGTVITLTATPASGYKFGSWSVTDEADNTITVTDNKFTMPASDVLVTATFDAIVYYDIVVDDSTANGTISASLDSAEEGTVITLTATPASGYKLGSWSVTDEAENTITVTDNKFTMPASDVLVTATFVVDSGEKTYTITWNSTNNSKGVSSYTDSWSVTANGFKCNMANWNNNNNGWNYVKCGSKKAVSIATIITAAAIPEAIKTVKITIDAVTAANINSIKLYVSDSTTFGSTEEASFEVGTGEKSVTISSPAKNKYYKLAVDCKQASNGSLTLSKLVFTTE